MDREKPPRTLASQCVRGPGEWNRNDTAWAKFLVAGAANGYQEVISFLLILLKHERIVDKTAYKHGHSKNRARKIRISQKKTEVCFF
jgi:hypothetical protein